METPNDPSSGASLCSSSAFCTFSKASSRRCIPTSDDLRIFDVFFFGSFLWRCDWKFWKWRFIMDITSGYIYIYIHVIYHAYGYKWIYIYRDIYIYIIYHGYVWIYMDIKGYNWHMILYSGSIISATSNSFVQDDLGPSHEASQLEHLMDVLRNAKRDFVFQSFSTKHPHHINLYQVLSENTQPLNLSTHRLGNSFRLSLHFHYPMILNCHKLEP